MRRVKDWIVLMAAVLLAGMQTEAVAKAANLNSYYQFNIPTQQLDAALLAFANQSGVQVLMWAGAQANVQSRGAVGSLTATAALRAILDDTGLAYEEVDPTTVAIFNPASREARVRIAQANGDATPQLARAAPLPQQTVAAPAQTETVQQSSDEQLEEVVVTGSSIRGVPPTGSSLNEVTREDIVATGGTTTTEILRSVPQLASFNATGINGGQDQANFVDQPAIHGIGVGNGGGGLTLVLMDGHRLPGAGINQTAPDPSAIPTAAIERVEIVADGASSIYGSDAVAGVMNFILRKNFDGAETAIKGGTADGYDTWNFSQILGKVWGSASAMVVFEHSENSALQGLERDYYGDNQLAKGATDARSTLCSPANVTVGGAGYALSGAGASAGTQNRCENNIASDLYPEQERNQGYVSLRKDVNDHIELFLSSIYSEREVRNREAASGSSNSKGGLAVTVPRGPFYDFVVGLGVPGTGPHTVTYNPSTDITSAFKNQIDARTQSTRFGANYSFGKDWVATLQGNYGLERDVISQFGINQSLALAAAANGTLNPYGVGPATNPAVLAAIGNYETRYTGRQSLQEVSLKADGSLFELGAAAVKGAFGISHREEEFTARFREGPVGGPDALPSVSSVGQREVVSIFGELFVPLLGDTTTGPGVAVSLSARYDDYDDFGDTTNPKIGVNWAIIEGLTLRASYGTSFHAPSLADASTAIDTRAIRFSDQTGSSDPAAYSIILAGGNRLEPETADTYSLGVQWQPDWLDGLKTDLSYWNVKYMDVITFPTFAPVSEPDNPTYDRYRIYNPTLAQVQEQTAGFRHDGLVFPDVPNLPTAIYDLRRQNFAEQNIDGIDFDLRYGFDTAIGYLTLGAGGTRLFGFDQQIKGDARVVSRLDTNAAIKTHARLGVGWSRNALSGNVFMNYSSGYRNTTQAHRQVDSFTTLDAHLSWTVARQGPLGNLVLTLDGSNVLDEEPPFYFDPGSNSNQHGYDGSVASALGRIVSVGLRKTF